MAFCRGRFCAGFSYACEDKRQEPKQCAYAWLEALGAPTGSEQAGGDWATLASYTKSDWQALPNVGPTRADALVAFFNAPEVGALADRLGVVGVAGFD